jgi:flavin-dependent dehydrogenase
VALVGDAAFAPSLLAGQGSALAMAAAYVLAGELARAQGHFQQAFGRYEEWLRTFMKDKQKAAEQFAGFFAPITRLRRRRGPKPDRRARFLSRRLHGGDPRGARLHSTTNGGTGARRARNGTDSAHRSRLAYDRSGARADHGHGSAGACGTHEMRPRVVSA